MKGKVLLGSFGLSLCLFTIYQTQVKQTVSAETKESISLQQEVASSVTTSSSLVSEVKEESAESTTPPISSIEEATNSEIEQGDSTASTTTLDESPKVTEESVAAITMPTSEAVNKVQTPLPAAKVEENYQFSVAKNQTTEEFIQTIGADAQQIAWNEGLYASVMIAQAILETGSGNSQLARPPHHNLFGIKGSYQGKNVSFNTQEDKGNGQLYTIQSAFRQYPSYKESLEDYAALLKKGLSGNPGFYQATWKTNAATYHEATKALTGKYATDTSYNKKLNALIETYELTKFDGEPDKAGENRVESSVESFADQEIQEPSTVESSMTAEEVEPQVITTGRRQKVMRVLPIAQRPAKQVAGNRVVE